MIVQSLQNRVSYEIYYHKRKRKNRKRIENHLERIELLEAKVLFPFITKTHSFNHHQKMN